MRGGGGGEGFQGRREAFSVGSRGETYETPGSPVRGPGTVLENWMWPKQTEREPSMGDTSQICALPTLQLAFRLTLGTDTDPHGAHVCAHTLPPGGGPESLQPSVPGVVPARTPVTLALWPSERSGQGGGVRAGGAADRRCPLSWAGSYPAGPVDAARSHDPAVSPGLER